MKNPEPRTAEMYQFVLIHALRFLTDSQIASLCYDLYCRCELQNTIDKRITDYKSILGDKP